jgi:hypothetical protein
MAEADAARQFSFRLPEGLIHRVEACMEHLRDRGLDVNRADVVRLLLKHALDTTHCKLELLFGSKGSPRRGRKSIA